jgi:voltage-gated potassium channel
MAVSTTKKRDSLRSIIQFYLIDAQTLLGKSIDIVIILVNITVCLLFVIETYPISESVRTLLWRIELGTVAFFIVEYCLRFYGASNRVKYVLDIYSIIDMVAIVPTLILMFLPSTSSAIGVVRILRVVKGFRIFRFLRFTHTEVFFFGCVTRPMLRVLRLLLTILIIFFISSGLFWFVENAQNESVATFGDAFYFTVVALTTVGFGDITPVTEAGRWVTVIMIISGIILIPWQASQIVREWMHFSDKQAVVCKTCGLQYHDKDASHCKSCGNTIFQEYDGH